MLFFHTGGHSTRPWTRLSPHHKPHPNLLYSKTFCYFGNEILWQKVPIWLLRDLLWVSDSCVHILGTIQGKFKVDLKFLQGYTLSRRVKTEFGKCLNCLSAICRWCFFPLSLHHNLRCVLQQFKVRESHLQVWDYRSSPGKIIAFFEYVPVVTDRKVFAVQYNLLIAQKLYCVIFWFVLLVYLKLQRAYNMFNNCVCLTHFPEFKGCPEWSHWCCTGSSVSPCSFHGDTHWRQDAEWASCFRHHTVGTYI